MSYGGGGPGALLEPFWEGARKRRLLLQACMACGDRHFPPTVVCPKCLSAEQTWEEASGRGRVASEVTFHQRYWDDRPTPYSVTLIELEEGPLMMSNPRAEGELAIGQPVRVVFEERADGQVIPQFVAA